MGSEIEYLLGASTVRRHVPLVTFPAELVRVRTLKCGQVVHWAIDEDADVVLISRDRDWFRSGLFREGRFTEFRPTRMTERGASAIPRSVIEDWGMIGYGERVFFAASVRQVALRVCRVVTAKGLVDVFGAEVADEILQDRLWRGEVGPGPNIRSGGRGRWRHRVTTVSGRIQQ